MSVWVVRPSSCHLGDLAGRGRGGGHRAGSCAGRNKRANSENYSPRPAQGAKQGLRQAPPIKPLPAGGKNKGNSRPLPELHPPTLPGCPSPRPSLPSAAREVSDCRRSPSQLHPPPNPSRALCKSEKPLSDNSGTDWRWTWPTTSHKVPPAPAPTPSPASTLSSPPGWQTPTPGPGKARIHKQKRSENAKSHTVQRRALDSLASLERSSAGLHVKARLPCGRGGHRRPGGLAALAGRGAALVLHDVAHHGQQ